MSDQQAVPPSAQPLLEVVPLGGLGEFGLNMMAVSFADTLLVIDAGSMFPEPELPGVDLVIPDMSYLQQRPSTMRALVLTHGHEDHIGAVPHIIKQFDGPVYGTPFTLALVEPKLAEHGIDARDRLVPVRPRDKIAIGDFTVEFLRVTHSMPDCVAVAIHTPVGVIIHTGDFKIDQTPIDGEHFDFHRFAELGAEGVLALFSDSTNIERPGFTGSELDVIEAFEEVFASTRGKLVVTSFATSVYRLQVLVSLAAQFKRKVAFVGRGMVEISQIAQRLGYLKVPAGLAIRDSDVKSHPPESVLCLVTGSQGEPMSALSRIAIDEHRHVSLTPDDVVVFSAREIPGNERSIDRVINHIARRGADIINEGRKHVHVSGHGSEEELKLLLSLVRPRCFIPIHGAFRQRARHARIGERLTRDLPNRVSVLMADNGDLLQFDRTGGRIDGRVPAGRVLIDGAALSGLGDQVLRDRRHLSEDGLIVPVIAINKQTGTVEGIPDLITRGLAIDPGPDSPLREAARLIVELLEAASVEERTDYGIIKDRVSVELRRFFRKRLGQRPLVLPVIMEIFDPVNASSTFSRRVSEFVGVLLFAAALMWLIALATYDPTDPAWFFNSAATRPAANLAGRAGAFLAELSFQLVGYAAYLFPVFTAALGWCRFWCRPIDAVYTKAVGIVLLFASFSAFLGVALVPARTSGRSFEPGGWLGDQLGGVMTASFNQTGSHIIILTLLFLSVILTTQFSFGRFFGAVSAGVRGWFGRRRAALNGWREERRRQRERRLIIEKHAKRAGTQVAEPDRPARSAMAKPPAAAPAKADAGDRPLAGAPPRPRDARSGDADKAAAAGSGWFTSRKEPAIRMASPPAPIPPAAPDAAGRTQAERRHGGFMPPPATLLDAPRTERKIDERELMESAHLLQQKCGEFAVAGSVVQIHPGPVVTTFEFKPDAGVKYSKITSLADDLSLALRAESVLIERTPGKSTVGIQIPNQNRDPISLRELLETDAYRRSTSKLTLALGKNIHGEPFMGDLAAMPHLLIAGATGTGKSVAINAMLTSILFRATPDDVRLILIDPKRLELGMYEEIPHLLTPVVVDPKQAANALAWAVREMEERYKTLAAEGVRNIEQYNRNVRHSADDRRTPREGEVVPKPLPYVVVVIDELADLMMVASNEVEESIARLAQMARAVGIHLVLATQRPSVDVITGLIKANLPARISFRVSSKVDSRTILDGNGAEQLLGRGDMLYLPPASSRLIRLHGPYISEQETARLSAFLRKQGKPVYDESITAEEKPQDALDFEKDDLYDDAARIVVGSGQASILYLQRRLRIGFSRAARLVDMMEAEGIVSGAMGGKPREVLVDKGYFDDVDQQLR